MACIATTSEDGAVELWTSTQGHFVQRTLLSKLLNMEMAKIRVTASEIGGGVGGKTTVYAAPLAIRLSQKTGRPVRMTMPRSEVFRATGPTVGSKTRIKVGMKKDGTITAGEAEIWYQAGAFKGSPIGRAVDTFFSPYTVANCKAAAYDVCVTRPKVAAYRAPGATMACYHMESVVTELAKE